jgi:hypothetical protein
MNSLIRDRKRFFDIVFWFAFVLFFIFWIECASAENSSIDQNRRKSILRAIRIVESNDGKNLIGDNGRAIGPYQIHYSYWLNAIQHDSSIGGCYSNCMNREYSEKIVLAYWNRYAPRNASDEILARIHNGGPNGHKKQSTISYWKKVQNHLR